MLASHRLSFDCTKRSLGPPGRSVHLSDCHLALQGAALRLSDYMFVPPTLTLQPWAGPRAVNIMESHASFRILNEVLCKVKVRRPTEGE